MRDRSDFLRPYELLENILTTMDGRKKLLARLGDEAEDGINELLNQALAYERTEVPSLTGFITHASSQDIDIKRQSDTSGNLVRIMTVHGAKGLESPIVILPHTIRKSGNAGSTFISTKSGDPIWNMSGDYAPSVVTEAKQVAKDADSEENQRLLYVAMTRAAYWFIGAGAGYANMPKQNWHADISEGLTKAGATRLSGDDGDALRLEFGNWDGDTRRDLTTDETVTNKGIFAESLSVPLPIHLGAPAPLSPSDLGGAKALDTGEDQATVGSGRQYGVWLHALLEALPQCNRALWPSVVKRLLDNSPVTPATDTTTSLLNTATRIIDFAPDIFEPTALTEVDVFAELPSLNRSAFGAIDRLIVKPDEVHCIDFKSNAVVPDRPEDVPEAIKRQMGAYLEALEAIWPNHVITIEVLWTSKPSRMVMEHAIVRDALSRSTTS